MLLVSVTILVKCNCPCNICFHHHGHLHHHVSMTLVEPCVYRRRLWGAAQTHVPNNWETPMPLSLFTTFSPNILVCPPNIFDKSTPVLVSVFKWFPVAIWGLEECPKWTALKEVLEEIEVDCRSIDQEFGSVRILVVAHDDRTCNQLKSVSQVRSAVIERCKYQKSQFDLNVHCCMNGVFI